MSVSMKAVETTEPPSPWQRFGTWMRRRLRALVRVIGGLVRAYAIAPVGVSMPIVIGLLFWLVPQMPGMFAGTIDGYAGQDASGLPAYDDAFWHQSGLAVGIILLSTQCWYWTRAMLNAAAGQYDGQRRDLPADEKWAVRLLLMATLVLGLIPVFRVNNLAEVPWFGVVLSLLFWLLLFVFLVRRRRWPSFRSGMPAEPRLPGPLTPRLFAAAPFGPRRAWLMLGYAVGGIMLTDFFPTLVERNLHTASGAMLGASCFVPLASVWLTLMRDLCRWMLQRGAGLGYRRAVRYAGWLGFALGIATPLIGSWAAGRLQLYPVPVLPDDGAWRAEAAMFPRPAGCSDLGRPLIVAAAGGASRAAAWEMTVFRALDVATEGRFSRCLSAISGVSGGSLGAVTYALARAQGKLGDKDGAGSEAFRKALVGLARFDMLPAVAFRLFSVDLLFGLPSRGPALAEAFEDYWTYWSGLGIRAPRFRDAFKAGSLPILALNGVDVRSGARLITSNMRFGDQDELVNIADGRDVLQHTVGTGGPGGFSAADAVLNSARFPIMSPPGLIPHEPDRDGDTAWAVVDGGVYEASGVATALELGAMLAPPPAPPPILVIISNDGTPWTTAAVDPAGKTIQLERKEYGPCATPTEADLKSLKQNISDASGQLPVPEFLTSLDGLYQTRSTRYLAELARARALYCGKGPSPKTPDLVFTFELPSPKPGGPAAVPMNWTLGSRDCSYMLGTAMAWQANRNSLKHLTNLLVGHDPPADFGERLKRDADSCRAPANGTR